MGRSMKTDYSYEGEPASIEQLNSRVTVLEENPPGGTSDYDKLKNKPSINGTELSGNKEGSDYSLMDKKDTISPARIDEICQ